jgi:uncharacterized protein YkuJ
MNSVTSKNSYVMEVSSSSLESIAYSASTETLMVKFKSSGDCYQYDDVGPRVAGEFKSADSYGKFLNGTIVPNFGFSKKSEVTYVAFCENLRTRLTLVPIVNIDWSVISADAEKMVWYRF